MGPPFADADADFDLDSVVDLKYPLWQGLSQAGILSDRNPRLGTAAVDDVPTEGVQGEVLVNSRIEVCDTMTVQVQVSISAVTAATARVP
ncbi:MAG TPA: hypothetical protein VE398_03640 [Acidobacteriota bacterium]|nr:hypothetical protein [Acidobacteriota bacterium]